MARKNANVQSPVTQAQPNANANANANAEVSIDALLADLRRATDAKDTKAAKGIRRKLRSRGHWGGLQMRANDRARAAAKGSTPLPVSNDPTPAPAPAKARRGKDAAA